MFVVAIRELLRFRQGVAFAIGGLVFGIVLVLRFAGLLQSLELGAYDRFLVWEEGPRPAREAPVTLVRIYEEDLRRYRYPICDGTLARALENLLEHEPSAIGVDLYRDAPVPCPDETRGGAGDGFKRLGEVIRGNPRIVMASMLADFGEDGGLPPELRGAEHQLGFTEIPVDPGGTVRRVLLMAWTSDELRISFPLQLVRRHLALEGMGLSKDAEGRPRLGPTTIPRLGPNDGGYVRADTGGHQFLLDYALLRASPPSFSLRQLLDGEIEPADVRGRVVLLGTTAQSVKDLFYTPFSRDLTRPRRTYGVEIHAYSVDQLLRFARGEAAPMESLGDLAEAAVILVLSLLGAAVGLASRSPIAGALSALAAAVLVPGGHYALFLAGWWLPIVPGALAAVGTAGLVAGYLAAIERYERWEVAHLFSRFLRPSVAEQIWEQREKFLEGDGATPRSRWVRLTTLAADLESYGEISEKLDPLVVMAWVNEFAESMALLIETHDGVVDDYTSDGITAHFGFPVARETEEEVVADARNAVRCAIEMRRRMVELNQRWTRTDLPTTRLRVGIMTGSAVVGVLGTSQSLKYTAYGDPISVAIRLKDFEGPATGDADARILIGKETVRRLDEDVSTVDVGSHTLRSGGETVGVFEVPATPGDIEVRETERRSQ